LSIPSSSSHGALVLCATALLTGLAAGALCCLLALMIKQDPIWLMLPIAVIIGALMRWQRFDGARGAAAAAGAMLICIVYTEYLYAAVRMADMLGFPLRDTLFRMDWRLSWQLSFADFSAWKSIISAFSPALAAAISWRQKRVNN